MPDAYDLIDESDVFTKFDALLLSLIQGGNADASLKIVVGVSGGGDSMALCLLLSRWVEKRGNKDVKIIGVYVDHGLRPESKEDAEQVKGWLASLPGIQFQAFSLDWDERPQSRVMERARDARMDSLVSFAKEVGAHALCLGHHQDDQVETVLFRFAKGSGLDGLCGISEHHVMHDVSIIRPLLGVSHAALLEYLQRHDQPWLEDPSNERDDFARVRLRQLRQGLEREGFSLERVMRFQKRVKRAVYALDSIASGVFQKAVQDGGDHAIRLNHSLLVQQNEEIALRVLLKAYQALIPEAQYKKPRLKEFEDIAATLLQATQHQRATLGGVVWTAHPKKDYFELQRECKD